MVKQGIKSLVGPGVAGLAFLGSFCFFQAAYPYHLIRREQLNLFLYDGDYLAETYRGTGWLAREKADSPVTVAQTAGPLSSTAPYYYQDNDIWLIPETYAILLSWTVQHETWIRSYDEIPAAVPLHSGVVNDITFILGGDKSLMFELHTTPQDVVTRDYTTNDDYNNQWD